MLTYASPEHGGGDISPTALLLRLMQQPQHSPLLSSQSIANIGKLVEIVHAQLFAFIHYFGGYRTRLPVLGMKSAKRKKFNTTIID